MLSILISAPPIRNSVGTSETPEGEKKLNSKCRLIVRSHSFSPINPKSSNRTVYCWFYLYVHVPVCVTWKKIKFRPARILFCYRKSIVLVFCLVIFEGVWKWNKLANIIDFIIILFSISKLLLYYICYLPWRNSDKIICTI